MASHLDFDPRLPAMSVLEDRCAVTELLAPGVGDCIVRRLDTKYEPGKRCVAAFEITVDLDPPKRTLGAVVVTPRQVTGFPAQEDPLLPRLPEALDPAAMATRLDGMSGRPTGTTWAIDLVRYKPGVRCVIRYAEAGRSPHAAYYGKMVAEGSVRQAETLSALQAAIRTSTDDAPRVLPVAAHWPDLGMLMAPAVQDAVELHDLASSAEVTSEKRNTTFAGAGRALAAFHECEAPGLPTRSLTDDVAELRGMQRAIELASPAMAEQYASTLVALEGLHRETPDPFVTSHGAFRTDQLMLSGSTWTLIDLDTVCRAEAARDLGNLLAYLDWKMTRQPRLRAALELAREAFLSGYATRHPMPAAERIATYRAASLTKIVGRRFRSLSLTEWPLTASLLALAEQVGTEPEMEPR